jgi:hypothetical protein
VFRIPTAFRMRAHPDPHRIGRRGFVYTPDKEPGPLTHADVGHIVRAAESQPPWIVVDHSKDSIVFTNWPGSLWLVEIVEPAPSSDQVTETYTRARVVRIIEASSATELFGTHGKAVVDILDQASRLQVADTDKAIMPQRSAHEAYSRAWNKWLKQTHAFEERVGSDHSPTLGVGSRGYDSPIGRGFVLLYNVLFKRVRELEGDSAFTVDDDGEIYFSDKWNRAFNILKHAAMARGAPELLSEPDRDVLSAEWNRWASSD